MLRAQQPTDPVSDGLKTIVSKVAPAGVSDDMVEHPGGRFLMKADYPLGFSHDCGGPVRQAGLAALYRCECRNRATRARMR
jgi:hypothetical protein